MRIAVTTAYGYWGNVSPDTVFKPDSTQMVGGGETAMFWLSRALAERGHQIDMFYDSSRPGNYGGINVLPKAMKLPMLMATDYDVLIAWEDTEAIAVNHRAKFVIYAVQCNTMQIGILDYGIDMYQAVSKWHCDTLFSSDSIIDDTKFMLVPNGVDLRRYQQQPAV